MDRLLQHSNGPAYVEDSVSRRQSQRRSHLGSVNEGGRVPLGVGGRRPSIVDTELDAAGEVAVGSQRRDRRRNSTIRGNLRQLVFPDLLEPVRRLPSERLDNQLPGVLHGPFEGPLPSLGEL